MRDYMAWKTCHLKYYRQQIVHEFQTYTSDTSFFS